MRIIITDHFLQWIPPLGCLPLFTSPWPCCSAPPLATSDDEDDDRSRFGDDDIEAETDANLRNYQGALSRSVDDCSNVLRSYRITSSMPNVVSATDWFGEDAMNHASSLENLLFVCRDFCLKLASQILKHIFIVL